ncbi:MAG: hypothetical protein KAQ69_11550, partial [Spirochaetales bacterium]|nr:hypothetical protein [Spirochaetales bacterium]
MYFHKIEHPLNFVFGQDHTEINDSSLRIESQAFGNDVYRIHADGAGCRRWELPPNETELQTDQFMSAVSQGYLEVSENGDFSLFFRGDKILSTRKNFAFGLCGKKWVFCFNLASSNRF